MKRKTNIFFCIIFLLNLLLVHKSFAQDKINSWSFGVGANAIDFFPGRAPGTGNTVGFLNELFNMRDHWNVSGPQFIVNRYLVQNLSIDGLISFNSITKYGDVKIDRTSYISFDLNLRYSFIDTKKDFTVFVLAGMGYTSFNPETLHLNGTVVKFGSGESLNFGWGVNYWFSDTVGINLEGFYKHSWSKLQPHFYYQASLVFRFKRGKDYIWRDGN